MNPAAATDRSSNPHYRLSRRAVAIAVSVAVILLVGLRAAGELAMMSEYGPDAQMAIWVVFLIIKSALWLFSGAVLVGLVIAAWPRRWAALTTLALLLIWTVAICAARWQFERARRALADASDPSTPPERLRELVNFDGIQAGYELDNRLASHPKTPPDALRQLYQRDQLGTQISLASNPKTPRDLLQELAEHRDEGVRRSLERNPNLPESVRRKLVEPPDEAVGKPPFGNNTEK